MTAFDGSTTRRVMTAFTLRVTLSRVMMSCGGTSSTSCRSVTRTIWSKGRKMRMTPGPFGVGIAWPRRKTTARSYSRRILIEPRTYRTTMTMMMRLNMLMAGRFLAQAVYRGACRTGGCAGGASCWVRSLWLLTDWPSEADGPVARFVGFAPLSLTSALSGDRRNCRSFAQDDGAERFASDDSVLPVR